MLKTWEHTYAASPDDVFEMLADPASGSRVSQTQNVVSHEVRIEAESAGFSMVNDQVQDTAGLPTIARKFVRDTTEFRAGDAWLAGDR